MRLGFLGVGWIGRNRLEAVARSGIAEIVGIADPSRADAEAARSAAPRARLYARYEDLLREHLDGVVIATPSAMHAGQALLALERGLAVFCQKPLGRTAAETRRVVTAARAADRLLGVDLSYRALEGVRRMAEFCRSGRLGRVFTADLVFHNAYGPDKDWFYDRRRSGGGCVMDLGIHLVDLALWFFGDPPVERVQSRLFAAGELLPRRPGTVEDYALATLHLEGGKVARLACSWRLSAGREAVIEATVYGTEGAVVLRNVNGSFYDFVAEHCVGTRREILAEPPDAWGGRAIVEWATQVASGARFDPAAERFIAAAEVIDAVYGRRSSARHPALA
jgi:predicted dehydrogenase